MGGEWATGRLGDCVRLQSGGTPSKSRPDYWGGDVPWISAKDMKSYWLQDSEDHLTELGAREATRIVDAGTTLILTRGMTLHNDVPICRVGRPSAFNQDVKAVVPQEGTDTAFVPYLLLGCKDRLLASVDSAGHGTGRLNTDTLLNLPVPMIPLEEQKRIAHILGTLDDKIELNRRMCQTLEEMARALFKSWFVDFDPVRAKAEGRQPYGMDAATAALFPDSFVDSELGMIPKGWIARPLGEVLREVNERVGEEEVPEYSSTNEGLQLRTERFKKQLSATTARNKLIRKGCLVFGLSRRVLNFGLMRDDIGSVSPVYRVFAVDTSAIDPDLLEQQMRASPAYYYNAVSASSREGQAVAPEALAHLRFTQPGQAVQQAFWVAADPQLALQDAGRAESHTLMTMRNALLPELLVANRMECHP